MTNSRRYMQLKKRIAAVEEVYLPPIRRTGNYTIREQDNIRAYLLLVHAEIESYFEEVSEKKAKEAFIKWKDSRTKSNVLLSLVSFCGNKEKFNELNIEERVQKALNLFIKKLKLNHGIKKDNILLMILSVGLEPADIDTTWLNTTSSFGTSRGEIAHKAAKVQQPLDPVTLKNTVQQILSGIENIDETLKNIK